jgi:hypothetical protein
MSSAVMITIWLGMFLSSVDVLVAESILTSSNSSMESALSLLNSAASSG